MDFTHGQKKLLLHGIAELNSAEKIPKAGETKAIETTPVTTKKLASDGGLEELLKKMGGVSLNDSLVTLGATEQTLSAPLERVDNNPQVFLGVQDKKGGETTMDPLRTNKKLVGPQMHASFYVPLEASRN